MEKGGYFAIADKDGLRRITAPPAVEEEHLEHVAGQLPDTLWAALRSVDTTSRAYNFFSDRVVKMQSGAWKEVVPSEPERVYSAVWAAGKAA